MKRYFKKVFKIIQMPLMKILPGQLAFFIVLSIIPILTLVGSLASFFSVSMDSVLAFATKTLPEEVINLLLPYVSGRGFDMNVFIFMFVGFILASNGPHSIIITSDTLFHFPHENYLTSRIKAFFMTILLVSLFFFSLFVLGFGNMIFAQIMQWKIFHFMTKELYFAFSLCKWPIAFFFIFYMIKLLYTIAPSKRVSSKYMNRGALITTIGFVFATAIYSYYVSHFAHYDIFYGGLSNIIILMIWVYILAYLLTFGIAVNAITYNGIENKNEKSGETHK